MSALMQAICKECGGAMREHADLGAFSNAPHSRLWRYECEKCGRTVTTCTQLLAPEMAEMVMKTYFPGMPDFTA